MKDPKALEDLPELDLVVVELETEQTELREQRKRETEQFIIEGSVLRGIKPADARRATRDPIKPN